MKVARILGHESLDTTATVFFGSNTRKKLLKHLQVTRGQGEDFLLLNQDGDQIKHRTVQDNIKKYALVTGITGVRPSPHTFRHTFAKMFLMGDGDPYVLRDLLGHNSMSTVVLYLKLFREDLHQKYKGRSPVDWLNGIKVRRPDVQRDLPFDVEMQLGN
ncbi:tyrosine-type recombinase/integrase [Desulfotruncus arcticus]|uniref:tyrosine-type recombinase/integrase n=1 Tax=Desulfotruncus arcticus TaxID=341036 RepID=UPI000B84EEBA|nr:tyrosine-type recombinase/integrase [Desulfotruncus arcticus]